MGFLPRQSRHPGFTQCCCAPWRHGHARPPDASAAREGRAGLWEQVAVRRAGPGLQRCAPGARALALGWRRPSLTPTTEAEQILGRPLPTLQGRTQKGIWRILLGSNAGRAPRVHTVAARPYKLQTRALLSKMDFVWFRVKALGAGRKEQACFFIIKFRGLTSVSKMMKVSSGHFCDPPSPCCAARVLTAPSQGSFRPPMGDPASWPPGSHKPVSEFLCLCLSCFFAAFSVVSHV